MEEEERREQLLARLRVAAVVLGAMEDALPPTPRISRVHLVDPDASPLMRLLALGDNAAYEKFLRVDVPTFECLHHRFQPVFEATPLRETDEVLN